MRFLLLLCAAGLLAPCAALRLPGTAPLARSRVAVSTARPAARVASAVGMSDMEREKETKKKSRLQTIEKTEEKTELQRKEKTEMDKIWRVILHNDDVHTFEYCTMAICKTVKTVPRKKAFKITMEAHMSGLATVTVTWKAQAKVYCTGLQQFGVTASIAPDQ
ncbi:ribosomal protein L7/L12, C-terminal/adaptor protein ClpS-like protein [Pavlovales sp. CCMP2436]|nr:ribosomal protein L7/L12, C-terminal/adaptor protein ClpS-like protein [Pavlovales sp. CCMP2436]|mmetsp:Transcript_3171/g.7816  ORF Transcript_3171/g.7816 Transcript_3171/m.7816 type:complete len:163 (+) Transcript_3171:58-546(+)